MPLAVLLVDDSAPVRERLAAMLLQVDGVSVAQASGVAAARVAIARHDPDVVVLDVHMPDGNGIELLRELRSSGLDAIKIVLTSYMLPPYRSMSLAAGAHYFLDRSTEHERLIDIVTALAASGRHER